MKLNIFGKKTLEVIFRDKQWLVFYCGNEGKKRIANDIVIPNEINEQEVIGYLEDLFHEWASPQSNEIKNCNF